MKRFFVLTVLLFFLCGCRAETEFTVSSVRIPCFASVSEEGRLTVLINKNSGKYHLDPSCVYAARMAEDNRLLIEVPDTEYLTEHGYAPCSRCSAGDEN